MSNPLLFASSKQLKSALTFRLRLEKLQDRFTAAMEKLGGRVDLNGNLGSQSNGNGHHAPATNGSGNLRGMYKRRPKLAAPIQSAPAFEAPPKPRHKMTAASRKRIAAAARRRWAAAKASGKNTL